LVQPLPLSFRVIPPPSYKSFPRGELFLKSLYISPVTFLAIDDCDIPSVGRGDFLPSTLIQMGLTESALEFDPLPFFLRAFPDFPLISPPGKAIKCPLPPLPQIWLSILCHPARRASPLFCRLCNFGRAADDLSAADPYRFLFSPLHYKLPRIVAPFFPSTAGFDCASVRRPTMRPSLSFPANGLFLYPSPCDSARPSRFEISSFPLCRVLVFLGTIHPPPSNKWFSWTGILAFPLICQFFLTKPLLFSADGSFQDRGYPPYLKNYSPDNRLMFPSSLSLLINHRFF